MRPILTAALLLITAPAFAAQGVGLSPIINNLTTTTKVATVKVLNNTSCASPFQFQVTRWTQKDGVDVNEPTEAVRAFPPIATIPAGGTQIVRIGRIHPANPGVEEAYRLDVQQKEGCADKHAKPAAGPTLSLRYHLSAPIFYRNPAWTAQLHAVWDNGVLKLRNDGKATADIFGVTVDGQPGRAHAIHILPGSAVPVSTTSTARPSSVDVRTSVQDHVALTVE